ncbi:hypothetical protein RCL1_007923 [Eukaryota sp. TZLM3-RCL]
MREFPLSLNQVAFLQEAISSGIRGDGRSLLQTRDPVLSLSTSSCLCTLGNTVVNSTIDAEIIAPFVDRPQEGVVNFFTHFSPTAAPDTSDLDSSSINRVVERIYRDTQCVELQSLCVTAGKRVWKLEVHSTILVHGGNIIDALVLNITCLLKNFKLPVVFINEEGESEVQPITLQPPIPLPLFHLPLSVTFAIIQDSLVVDPNVDEESIADCVLSIVLNLHNEICGVFMNASRNSISREYLFNCIELAKSEIPSRHEYLTAVKREGVCENVTESLKSLVVEEPLDLED